MPVKSGLLAERTLNLKDSSIIFAVTFSSRAVFAPHTPLGIKQYFARALEAMQLKKRPKLDKILALAQKKGSITNDDVEKLVHVSDSTVQRYLAQLVRESKLIRVGPPSQARYEPTRGSATFTCSVRICSA